MSNPVLDHPVISADGHIDLPLLPHDLFTAHAPAELRGQVPRVETLDDGQHWVWGDGAELARVGGTGHTGVPYTRGQSARFDRMNQSRLLGRGRRRCDAPDRSSFAGRRAGS